MASFDFLDNILNLYLFHVPTFLCIKEIFNAGHILPSYTPTFFDKTNEPDFRLDFCKCYMEVHDGVYIIL